MNHPETGPEHFAEAQRLIAPVHVPADRELGIEEHWIKPSRMDVATAQVHATLALAYATAMQPGTRNGWVPGFTDDRNRDDR